MAYEKSLRLSLVAAVMIAVGITTNCTHKAADADKAPETPSSNDSTRGGNSPRDNDGSKAPGDIVAQVREKIASDPNIRSKTPQWRDFNPTINVKFADGTIQLRGKVATDEESVAVGNDALSVPEVLGVANYLVAAGGQRMGTQGAPPRNRSEIDASITAVLQNIRSDPKVTGKIQVCYDVSGDLIRLTGRVASDEERTLVTNDSIYVTDIGVLTMISLTQGEPEFSTTSGEPPAPWSEPDTADKPSIPVCAGLTVVTAIASDRDYESIKTIESASAKGARVKYSAEVGPPWWTDPRPEAKHLSTTHRTVLTTDLESGHSYDQIFVTTEHSSETSPGSTAIGTSAAVLRDLKTKGEAELSICRAAEDVQVMDHGQLHPGSPGGCYNFSSPITIRRVGNEPAHLRVLVNGSPVDLPAVHAKSETGEEEFFFLDDERNPPTLAFRLGIRGMSALTPHGRQLCEEAKTKPGLVMTGPVSCDLPHGGDADKLRVTEITTAECTKPAAPSVGGAAASAGTLAMEKSLAETGKVDVYSLYFAFNSDAIRDESEPTLKEIANVLRRHSDWRLRVAGHTDGIGNDEQNLDLSKRRAAAVKDALVKHYGIAADRLSTTGFGKSQPKDTNDTLEGRAHNRRVELMKIS